MLNEEQELFLQHLETNLGITSKALQNTNTDRETYTQWLENKEFKHRIETINDTSLDYVENQLLVQINKGDLSAIQFYLKTKGKKRGY